MYQRANLDDLLWLSRNQKWNGFRLFLAWVRPKMRRLHRDFPHLVEHYTDRFGAEWWRLTDDGLNAIIQRRQEGGRT